MNSKISGNHVDSATRSTDRKPAFPLEGRSTRWRWHIGPDFPKLGEVHPVASQILSEDALQATEARLTNYDPIPEWAPRAGRRNLRVKLFAGLVGFKHAIRGDSSFFAHFYRALLVFLTAAMIAVPPLHWALLVFGFTLVVMAELAHSAIDQLARAIGDPEEPRLKTARDIAASMVLVAVAGSATISIIVLVVRFITLLEA